MSAFHEERIGSSSGSCGLLPRGWVQAAQELPAARRAMDEIVARAEADAAFQAALVGRSRAALAQEGYEPSRRCSTSSASSTPRD